MKWKVVEKPYKREPRVGDRREVRVFLWLPETLPIKNDPDFDLPAETRWLEYATIDQRYSVQSEYGYAGFAYWEDRRFVGHE